MAHRRCRYGRLSPRVSGGEPGACRKHPIPQGLDGAKRTCVKFTCKPGRAAKPSKRCDAGEVLRCAKYAPVRGRSPLWGQRKGYAQYIYGRPTPGSRDTVRRTYPPYDLKHRQELPTSEQISKKRKVA